MLFNQAPSLVKLAFLITLTANVWGERYRDFSFEPRDDGVAITGYSSNAFGDVRIPEEIDDKPVRVIATNAFRQSTIDTVYIPENVLAIEDYAFGGSGVNEVKIPASMNDIAEGAFRGCSQLYHIEVVSDNPYYLSIDGVLFNKSATELIFCPSAKGSPSEGFDVPASVVALRNGAFYESQISNMNLPDGLTSIGGETFRGSTLRNIVIPESVTEIGLLAFLNCRRLSAIHVDAFNVNFSSLDGVLMDKTGETLILYPEQKEEISYNIPNEVTRIAAHAFNDPTMLVELTIGQSISIIEEEAISFQGSSIFVAENNSHFISQDGVLFTYDLSELISFPKESPLKDYQIPAGVKRIGTAAFRRADNILKVTLPEGLTFIGNQAFDTCRFLYSVNLPSTLVEIQDEAFEGCSNLSEISLPENLSHLGNRTFNRCRFLQSVVIPEGVTELKEMTFQSCSGLKSVTLASTLVKIGDNAFSSCRDITEIVFPDGLKEIGSSAFSGCESLAVVRLPDSLEILGANAFLTCKGITSITIPPLLRRLESGTFTNCEGLFEILIPENVEFIGESAFGGSSGLEWIHVHEDNPYFTSVDGALLSTDLTRLLKYPVGKLAVSYSMPAGVRSIDEWAFYNSKLESVYLPASLERIGNGAFELCRSLMQINLSNNVSFIGESAFRQCWELESINIPLSLSSLADQVFEDCRKLRDVTVPGTIKAIGDFAFRQCYELASVIIEPGTEFIGNGAFQECFALNNLQLPQGLNTIGDQAFRSCENLRYLVIPSGVLLIGDEAFFDCWFLEAVKFPSSLKILGMSTFNTCRKLTSVQFSEGLEEIGRLAFGACESLTTITIPESVSVIGEAAFAFCYNLTNIYFKGDAPTTYEDYLSDNLFDEVNESAKVYFFDSATGFKTPTWIGLPSVNLGVTNESLNWRIDNQLPHMIDLDTDPRSSGTPLLANYALNQQPGRYQTPQLNLSGNQLAYKFYGERSDITYFAEVSKDLFTWTTDGVTLTEPDMDGMRTASVNLQDGRCFVRFRFVQDS